MSQKRKKAVRRRRKYRLKPQARFALIGLVLLIGCIMIIGSIIQLVGNRHNYDITLKDAVEILPISFLDISKLQGEEMKSYEDDLYTSTLGVDVSMHQKSINWEKVKESGITFAYIRCGYRGYQGGVLHEDPTFKENISGAKAAGLKVGVYFFSQATTMEEAIDEAYFTQKLIKDYAFKFPVVYDLEDIDYDVSRIQKTSNEQRTNHALAFCAKVEEFGYQPMIYANIYWLNSIYDINRIMNYPLWIADYDNIPSFEYEFKIWQYSETASINGIEEPVDLNLMLIKK